MDESQKNIAISWLNDNFIDHNLLQRIISENSNTVIQTITKYSNEHNKMYSKKLKSPMTENVLNYVYYLYKEYPNTFNRFSMNINNDIVYSDKMQINLPELTEKIKNDNISLIEEKRKLHNENRILREKYEKLLNEKINNKSL